MPLSNEGGAASFPITDERLLPRVNSLVDDQVMLCGKALSTILTVKLRPLADMSFSMSFETRGLTERLVADIAGEGLFLGMGSFVDHEIGFTREVPTALIALERTRSSVHSSVYLQILNGTKSSRTRLAFERLLARVDSLMFDEAGFPRKAFAASLAAEWLNFGVLQLMNSQIALHAKGFPACN